MLTLFFCVVGLAVWIRSLVQRLTDAEVRLYRFEQIAIEARARLDALEAKQRAVHRPADPVASPVPAPAVAPPPISAPTPATAPAPAAPVTPVAASPQPAIPRPPAAPPPPLPPADPSPPTTGGDEWEVTVGSNWLNKIGVLVFVIGLALLIGYSVTRLGPAGRIAIGFAVSAGMLAAGVLLERRDGYRTYAYGLLAGGWAGTYFTTYAMRAVPAAQIIESDLAAVVCLSGVAAGMIWHSLRYRSQEVTSLAYIVAYATLALTPLGGFSLVASIPLAVTVLVVSARFGWTGLQVLGIIFTYGLYVVRGQAFGLGDLDASSFTPYLALGAYWLMFEAADLLAMRRQADTGIAPAPVFLLNAAGLVGSGLLRLPLETPFPLSTFLALGGAAYLASAVIRSRLATTTPDDQVVDHAFRGSYHGASALAVLLVAWSIELRFTDSRLVLALLMQATLVFVSGLILRDWVIRGLGSAVAVFVSLHAMWLISGPQAGSVPWSVQAPSAVAMLTALVWYASREWLRARNLVPLPQEWLFTPVATYLVVLVARAELQMGWSSLATLALACVLLEAGLRRGAEYRYQAYAVGGASAVVLLTWFGGQRYVGGSFEREAWIVLMSAMAISYFSAWRVAPARNGAEPDRRQRVWAAAFAGAFGTSFVIMLQWIVIAPDFVALAWAATGTTIGVAGLQWKLGGLRWQMYPVLGLALLRAMGPVLDPTAARPIEVASALVVVGFLYAFSLAVRQAVAHTSTAPREIEDAVRVSMSLAATVSLVTLILFEVRPTLVTVTWGVLGALLLAAGFPARERVMRLSGLAVLLACIARLFVFDLPQLEELARIISFVVLGAVLLTVSWFYTRYRARLQKFL